MSKKFDQKFIDFLWSESKEHFRNYLELIPNEYLNNNLTYEELYENIYNLYMHICGADNKYYSSEKAFLKLLTTEDTIGVFQNLISTVSIYMTAIIFSYGCFFSLFQDSKFNLFTRCIVDIVLAICMLILGYKLMEFISNKNKEIENHRKFYLLCESILENAHNEVRLTQR